MTDPTVIDLLRALVAEKVEQADLLKVANEFLSKPVTLRVLSQTLAK